MDNKGIHKASFLKGLCIGILLALVVIALIWVLASIELPLRVNRTDPISTASAIAIAFLEKDYEGFIEFVPATYSAAQDEEWWNRGGFIYNLLFCETETTEYIKGEWIADQISQDYEIRDVLVQHQSLTGNMSVEVVVNYRGDSYVMLFYIQELSNEWWIDTPIYICFVRN